MAPFPSSTGAPPEAFRSGNLQGSCSASSMWVPGLSQMKVAWPWLSLGSSLDFWVHGSIPFCPLSLMSCIFQFPDIHLLCFLELELAPYFPLISVRALTHRLPQSPHFFLHVVVLENPKGSSRYYLECSSVCSLATCKET